MNEETTCRVIGQMDNTIDHTFESANRVYDKEGLCPTIPTCAGGNIQPKVIERGIKYRIRKLTPLECYRLMGVTDEDANKMLAVNSNSKCYQQAGDSIVVDVMCAMFRKLNIKGVKNG